MTSPADQKVAICTAGNARFFEHLDGLIASLEASSLPKTWQVCLFDVGLTVPQRVNFESRGVKVVSPEWSLDFPHRQAIPPWFKAMVNRPFLPQHFPGFEVYLWLDADTWVQNPACLFDLVHQARSGAVALVIEKFGPPRKYRWVQRDGQLCELELSEPMARENIEKCYRLCFGPDKAHHAQGPITNSGVLAIRSDSPAWSAWQHYLAIGLRPGAIHVLVEQQALNLAYLEGRIAVESMPLTHNWNMTTFHPLLDPSRGLLVDLSDRTTPVGIVHVTDLKKLDQMDLQTTRGESVAVPLLYREFAAKFGLQRS